MNTQYAYLSYSTITVFTQQIVELDFCSQEYRTDLFVPLQLNETDQPTYQKGSIGSILLIPFSSCTRSPDSPKWIDPIDTNVWFFFCGSILLIFSQMLYQINRTHNLFVMNKSVDNPSSSCHPPGAFVAPRLLLPHDPFERAPGPLTSFHLDCPLNSSVNVGLSCVIIKQIDVVKRQLKIVSRRRLLL